MGEETHSADRGSRTPSDGPGAPRTATRLSAFAYDRQAGSVVVRTLDGVGRDRLAEALGPARDSLSVRAKTSSRISIAVSAGRPLATAQDWREIVDSGAARAKCTGAFALAWHGPRRNAHLARDAIGERTLFYAPLSRLDSSSRRPFAARWRPASSPRQLNLRAVARVPLLRLPAGPRDAGRGRVRSAARRASSPSDRPACDREPFWELPPDRARLDPGRRPGPPAAPDTLEDAVPRRLPAGRAGRGVPLRRPRLEPRRRAGAATAPRPVHTYSVSFGPDYANELPFSSLVADHCGTEHRVVELSPAVVLHHLDDSVGLLERPDRRPADGPERAAVPRRPRRESAWCSTARAATRVSAGRRTCRCCWPSCTAPAASGRAASYLRAHLKCYDDLPAMLAEPVLRSPARAAPLEAELSAAPRRPALAGLRRAACRRSTSASRAGTTSCRRSTRSASRSASCRGRRCSTAPWWSCRSRSRRELKLARLDREVPAQAGRARPAPASDHRPAEERHAGAGGRLVPRAAAAAGRASASSTG